jgi:site-specific DNA-methyltransferase (adenine-specific)
MTDNRSLETFLADIGAENASSGRWLTKSELLDRLTSFCGDDAETVFAKIRAAARCKGFVGSIAVHSIGEKRGTRYAFGDVPDTSTPSPAFRPQKGSEVAKPSVGGIRDFAIPARPPESGSVTVVYGDNLDIIRAFDAQSFDLIYVDPPFNTGRAQSRTRIKTERDDQGDRVGFQGRRYRTTVVGVSAYSDSFDDYMAFLVPRLEEAYRLLKPNGSFFLHLDYREVHYAKVVLDQIFGRESFINEIIWAYDYGARATNRWSAKHDNILWYAKNPNTYCFNFEEMDRIPYMAPSLVGEEKAARGKTPTDTWWHTIVSPNGKEKTGYPTQKPLGVLSRIVRIHSRPGDRLLDFFAGSGSFGEAAASFGRHATLVDNNPEAIEVMRRRFVNYAPTFLTGNAPVEPRLQAASDTADNSSNTPIVSRGSGGVPSGPHGHHVDGETTDTGATKKGTSGTPNHVDAIQRSLF